MGTESIILKILWLVSEIRPSVCTPGGRTCLGTCTDFRSMRTGGNYSTAYLSRFILGVKFWSAFIYVSCEFFFCRNVEEGNLSN